MARNKLQLTFIFIFSWLISSGQYANDWIDFNQRYFEIPVTSDGMFTITSSQMLSAGIPISTINPDRFQVFRKGEELAIRVEKTAENVVSKIHFYGHKNDGAGDAELYRSPELQPHQYYSLFTETAPYFLTWRLTGTGKRMVLDTDLTPATPESYHWAQDLRIESSDYSLGEKYGTNNDFSSGLYDLGEGWTGASKGKTEIFTYTFQLANPNTGAGAIPQLEVLFAGQNNQNHRIEISAQNGAVNTILDTVDSFTGFETALFNSGIAWSQMNASNQVVVNFKVLGYDGTADQISVSYLSLKYPQSLSLSAGQNKLFQLREAGGVSLYTGLTTTESTAGVYDVTDAVNPVIRGTQYTGGVLYFVADNSSVSRQIRVVSSEVNVSSLTETLFDPINPVGNNYLIITHDQMRLAASDGLDPVSAIQTYRETDYNVHIADIDELYDQFNYGEPGPLAIKNYLKYALSVTSPEHVFLIGKGTTHEKNPYRSSSTSDLHLIPTYGIPGSDVLYTVGLTGNTNPELSIGRLNALTSEGVKQYLDKVKVMESLPYDELWRKNLIHLSGGVTTAELNQFQNAVNGFSRAAESDFLGGKNFNRSKETTDAVEFINIVDVVNQGVGMITFFGHSSSQATDVEIGLATTESGYTNTNKYPILFINGCDGGAIFENTQSFGDNWLFAKNLGATSVIAHSDYALSSELRRFANLFYEYAYNTEETFGSPIGEIMKLTQNAYLNLYGSSDLKLAQAYGMLLEGDPALKVFAAEAPDYEVGADDISADPVNADRIVSTAPSFALKIGVSNFGRTVTDSLTVKIDRTLADGSVRSYTDVFVRPLYYDSLTFEIVNDPADRNDGNNLFLITLDPDNDVSELNELNNAASFELYIPKGNTIHLFPIDNGVTDQSLVKFSWQPTNILEDERSYSFQLDTSAGFGSPYFQSMELSGSVLLSQTLDFVGLPDSTTIYWRTRFAEKRSDEDTSWVNASFTIVQSQPSGWGQFTSEQLSQNSITGIYFNKANSRWEFQETTLPVFVSTHSINNTAGLNYSDFKVLLNGLDIFSSDSPYYPCELNSINAVVFDRESAGPILPQNLLGDVYDNYIQYACGREPPIIINLTSSELDVFDALVTGMSDGDAILLFSVDSINFSSWDTQMKALLADVGVSTSTINSLVDGQPVIFLGKKGMAEGEALAITDNGSGLPADQQALELDDEVSGVYTSGFMSADLGPAKSWTDLNFQIQDVGLDNCFVRVTGVNESGAEQEFFYLEPTDDPDFSMISAAQYPYMKLRLELYDNDDQLPANLSYWSVDYVPAPEGILIPVDKSVVSLDEGAEFAKDFKFINISDQDFIDSVSVVSRLTNINSSGSVSLSQKLAGPVVGDTLSFSSVFPTINRGGENNLTVTVSPGEPEQYSVNNTLNLSRILDVAEDETNPVMDVTFDGVYILDGDIVSPSPKVLIRFKDDNSYLIKDDTIGMNVSLKAPCETCDYERVNLTDPKISYSLATEDSDFEIEYLPGPLEDGIYYLRVQGEDESGNTAGMEPYEISFEVINESTITHFYPYPNPFSTSTRFVFTLTGSEIPDQIKIQIMTVSGRVVREITQDEIGPLRIGNNITQYAWDGRDEFGDRLANGVYLYKVFVRQSGDKIKHRSTSADRAFKNGFGKMYILR